jgi:hypothetical protein
MALSAQTLDRAISARSATPPGRSTQWENSIVPWEVTRLSRRTGRRIMDATPRAESAARCRPGESGRMPITHTSG